MSFSIDPVLIELNLSAIEREFDTKTIKFNDFFVWNAVRALLGGLHLWSFNSKGFLDKSERKTIAAFNILSSKRFNELYIKDKKDYFIASRDKNIFDRKYDVLFFESYDSLAIKSKDKLINRIFEPFKVKLNNLSCLSVFPYDDNARKIDFDNDVIFYKKSLDKYLRSNYQENNIKGLRELFNFIKNKGYICPFSYDYVDSWIKSIFIRSEVFVGILKQFKPRLVFLTSFYSSERMAVVLACKKLGIKTIEVQHGMLGSNFYKLPFSVIEKDLIPDYFWLWGNDAKEYMQNMNNSYSHNLIIGGKLDLFDELRYEINTGSVASILLIEQYTHNHTLDLVKKAVAFARKINIKVLLRLHPRSHHLISEYKELFSEFDSFEVEKATLSPLYQLMRDVDTVIVESSTVAHEAVFFGKRVFLYGDNAKKYFSKYIENGSMSHFGSYSDIFDISHKNQVFNKNISSNSGYFLSCELLMNDAWKNMLRIINGA